MGSVRAAIWLQVMAYERESLCELARGAWGEA